MTALAKKDLDVRIFLSTLGQQRGEPGLRYAIGQRNPKLAAKSGGSALDAGLGLFDHGEDPAGFFEQYAARPGQTRSSGSALEQLYTKPVLQVLDDARQGRLLDMQPCGRPSEVQFFGNDDEAAKVAKLHGYYLPTGYLRVIGYVLLHARPAGGAGLASAAARRPGRPRRRWPQATR